MITHFKHLFSVCWVFFLSQTAHCDLMHLLNYDFLFMKLLTVSVCYLCMHIVCLGLDPADHLIAQL